MKAILYISLLALFNCSYSQVRVIDLVFTDSDCGQYASLVANSIEHNEINAVYNVLSYDFDYDSVQFEEISASINKFYRPVKHASPGYLNVNPSVKDSCYFERHYFIEEENEIKYLGQLIISSTNSDLDNPIYAIEYLSKNEFIDRSEEIRIAFNGGWMNKELNYEPSPRAKRITQDTRFKININRDIQTSYVNKELNFGFEIDTSNWEKIINIREDITQIFEGNYLEKLQSKNDKFSSVEVAHSKLKPPIFESAKEFEENIVAQLNSISFKGLSFSDIEYDESNSILQFNSILKKDNVNTIHSRHLFFSLSLEEAIYLKINSIDLDELNELSRKIKGSFIIK